MAVGQLPYGTEISHRNRLSAGGVVGYRNNDKGHMAFVFGHGFFKFFDIDIALEWMFELGVAGFVNGAVYSKSLAALYVAFCSVEM